MSALLEQDMDPFDVVEAHWSTGTIMAIFFAASLISAVFVGLGYSFGMGATAKQIIPLAIARPLNMTESAGHPAAVVHARPTPVGSAKRVTDAGSSRYMVQIGAIANRRDAERLEYRLRRKGFHAAIYPGKHDRYLHVQIGPFTRMEQAQAVRRHVRASGFRAILTHAS